MGTRTRRLAVASLPAALILTLLPISAPARSAALGQTDVLGPLVRRLLHPHGAAPTLPDDPTGALIDEVNALASVLGVALDASEKVRSAGLPSEVAGRLALLTRALHRCHRKSARLVDEIGLGRLDKAGREDGSGPKPSVLAVHAVRDCAVDLQESALEALSFFVASLPPDARVPLDIWPVLRFEPVSADDYYAHDYALTIDLGGNDVYANNAGGNLLDVVRGPAGSAAVEVASAQGCQKIRPDATGEPTETGFAPPDCVISSAASLDAAGDDTYGVFELPDFDAGRGDARCTADPLIRRILTEGAGLAGAGLLVDFSGNDVYNAKTISQGAGHLGGVGILRDQSGDDSYLAIRNSQGFALVSGVGVLDDVNGNDSFDFYMPSPLDPNAGFQKDGSGGVVDDTGACDNLPRMLQGTGIVEGIGIFLNEVGADSYSAPKPAVQQFASGIRLNHGSQGFGVHQGLGFFFDLGGTDGYDPINGPDRHNDQHILIGDEDSPDGQGKSTGEFLDAQ